MGDVAFRNAKYNRHGTIDIEIQVGDEWWPFTADPNDVAEHGRQLYAAAVEAGNIAPYVPPTAEEARLLMPDLSAKQFRLGMISLGLTSSGVSDALNNIADALEREKAQIEWEYSTSFSRLHPLIGQLATTFSLTDDQIDAAWTQALTYN